MHCTSLTSNFHVPEFVQCEIGYLVAKQNLESLGSLQSFHAARLVL
jgi:hypothetical protein